MSITNVLAISGSLRARSTNTEVLRAAALVAPPSVRVTLFVGLDRLPHFNPDLDTEAAIPLAPVHELRSQVDAADGLLICSPEYAHGVPGALKNALDWLVSGPEILYQPIGLLNASPHSTHARDSLAETLRTMSTLLVPRASLDLPLAGRRLEAAAIVAEPVLAQLLRESLAALVAEVATSRQMRAAVRRPVERTCGMTACPVLPVQALRKSGGA